MNIDIINIVAIIARNSGTVRLITRYYENREREIHWIVKCSFVFINE